MWNYFTVAEGQCVVLLTKVCLEFAQGDTITLLYKFIDIILNTKPGM